MKNDQRIERILDSLGGLQKAAAPDFFYTRLLGKMQTTVEPARKSYLLLRPAFAMTALSIVFVINIISLTQLNRKPAEAKKPASIESFAEAYGMNTRTVYE